MIATVAAVLGIWTAAAIPTGILVGRRLHHLNPEEPMPDQPNHTPQLSVRCGAMGHHGRCILTAGHDDSIAHLYPTPATPVATTDASREPTDTFIVLAEVAHERGQQDARWGEQNHPDGTGKQRWRDAANYVTNEVDDDARLGRTTWNGVLREELFEALAESDPVKLRAELLQVAAVAVAWIEAIDRRPAGA